MSFLPLLLWAFVGQQMTSTPTACWNGLLAQSERSSKLIVMMQDDRNALAEIIAKCVADGNCDGVSELAEREAGLSSKIQSYAQDAADKSDAELEDCLQAYIKPATGAKK